MRVRTPPLFILFLLRDLKPENILLKSSSGGSGIDWSLIPAQDIQVKITDFGLAKFYSHDVTSFTMTVAGTPFYMCPKMWEAMLCQQPFRGHWSVDLYSMGVIAYELLAGDRKEGIQMRYPERTLGKRQFEQQKSKLFT